MYICINKYPRIYNFEKKKDYNNLILRLETNSKKEKSLCFKRNTGQIIIPPNLRPKIRNIYIYLFPKVERSAYQTYTTPRKSRKTTPLHPAYPDRVKIIR